MFRAYDAERERLVAVKFFRLDLPPERVHQLVGSFEELIAAELSHRAMVVPLATGITGVSAYLAQDYVAAESLDLAVREYGPAPPVDALRVAAQLAGALDFAAVVNVSHGALHPRDVLLSADETRLTGVGIARALDRVGVAAPVRRPYTAPERIAGGTWDRRADVFSLAALLYELLWGRRVAGHGRHAADGLTELPGARLKALQATFARALAEDPHDRFGTALEFAESLKDAFPDVALTEPVPPKKRLSSARKANDPRLPLEEPVPLKSARLESGESGESVERIEPLELHGPREPILNAFELHATDPERYQDVETTPAVAAPEVTMSVEPPAERPPISVLEQSRSAVWPLMAALVIGLAIGFAGGYGIGSRERMTPTMAEATTAPLPPTPPASPAPPARVPAGRETTEVAVAQAPKPANTASGVPARGSVPAPAASGTAGRFVGRLSVESRPEGARVFLDGKLIGTTPLAMPSVSAGEHAIRLEREGYHRWSSSVRIVATEQNRVTASLER